MDGACVLPEWHRKVTWRELRLRSNKMLITLIINVIIDDDDGILDCSDGTGCGT